MNGGPTAIQEPRRFQMLLKLVRAYDTVTLRVLDKLGDVVLLALRGWWGWQLFKNGKNKLDNIVGIVEYFDSLHIPFPGPNAYFVSYLEMIGGVLLLVGLFARPIALLLAGNMTVAYIAADWPKVRGIFRDPDAFVSADPFMYLVVALLVLAFGPGRIALDTVVRKLVDRKLAPAAQMPAPVPLRAAS